MVFYYTWCSVVILGRTVKSAPSEDQAEELLRLVYIEPFSSTLRLYTGQAELEDYYSSSTDSHC